MSIINLEKNIKIQLKARLRLSCLLEQKPFNFINEKKFLLPNIKNSKLSSSTINIKKLNNTNFYKYKKNFSLLKNKLEKMSIKDIYKNEKLCSLKCDEICKEIEDNSNSLKKIKLPKIRKERNVSLKNIKLNNTKIINVANEKLNFSDSNMAQSLSLPTYSSSKKITSYSDNIKNKDKINYSQKKNGNNSKIFNIFNSKMNFSIIKKGIIRYNNSIFKNKDINNLLRCKSLQMVV